MLTHFGMALIVNNAIFYLSVFESVNTSLSLGNIKHTYNLISIYVYGYKRNLSHYGFFLYT